MDLALNNLQRLICRKTQQTKFIVRERKRERAVDKHAIVA